MTSVRRQAALQAARAVGMAVLGAGAAWCALSLNSGVLVGFACALLALAVVARTRGLEGVVIALVTASMLPLPAVASLGTADFPLASVTVVILVVAGTVVSLRGGDRVRVPHAAPYLALLGVAALSLLASFLFWDQNVPSGAERGYGHRSLGYEIAGYYLLAVPLAAYAGGVLTASRIRLQWLFTAVGLALTGLTLYALVTWLHHPENPIDAFYTYDRDKLDHQWTAYLLVFAVGLALHVRSARMRATAVALLAVGGVTVLVEYVLSAWLGVLAAVAFMIWLRFGGRGLLVMLTVCAVGTVAFEPTVMTIVTQRANSPDADRLQIWQSALTVWSRSPFIGVGPSNLAGYMERYSLFPLGLVLQGYQQAHNILLEILAEEGVGGLALLLLFVGLVMRSIVRVRPLDSSQAAGRAIAGGMLIASAVMSALGGGFIPTIASAGYNALPYVLVVWFLAGAVVHGAPVRNAARSLHPMPLRWHAASAPA